MEEIKMNEPLIELKATNGVIKVYDNMVVISRNTLMGFSSQGGFAGDRQYYYSELASVEYKKPNMMINGFMKFVRKGTESKPAKINLMGATSSTIKDPDTVILRAFNSNVPVISEKIHQYVLGKISQSFAQQNTQTQNTPHYSAADELQKYGNLFKQGIITEAEFLAKKSELLNM